MELSQCAKKFGTHACIRDRRASLSAIASRMSRLHTHPGSSLLVLVGVLQYAHARVSHAWGSQSTINIRELRTVLTSQNICSPATRMIQLIVHHLTLSGAPHTLSLPTITNPIVVRWGQYCRIFKTIGNPMPRPIVLLARKADLTYVRVT